MELEQSNIPMVGDILDNLAMIYREIITKVSWIEKMLNGSVSSTRNIGHQLIEILFGIFIIGFGQEYISIVISIVW